MASSSFTSKSMGKNTSKSDRLYLRLDTELKGKVQDYCVRNHTTVSDVVTRFLVRLLTEDEQRRYPADVEQI